LTPITNPIKPFFMDMYLLFTFKLDCFRAIYRNPNNRALSTTRWHYQSQVQVAVFLNNYFFAKRRGR
jgi:hypothetical protein